MKCTWKGRSSSDMSLAVRTMLPVVARPVEAAPPKLMPPLLASEPEANDCCPCGPAKDVALNRSLSPVSPVRLGRW